VEVLQKKLSQQPTGPHGVVLDSWISCAPFEKLLNMNIIKAKNAEAILKMPFQYEYAQGAGLMHGGALVSLADTAVVMAIKSIFPPQTHFATIGLESRFLRPVKQGIVTAHAHAAIEEGRKIKGRATVYDESDQSVLEFLSTFKVAKDPRIK